MSLWHRLHARWRSRTLCDELMECELHHFIANLPGPPRKPGRYRVFVRANQPPERWAWEALS